MAGPFLESFGKPLLEGALIKRYKRFLADVAVPALGKSLTVHCPNTGSMLGLNAPGCPVLISDSQNPGRTLRYTLECIRNGKTWVCVNTQRANHLTKKLIERGLIPGLEDFTVFKNEPRIDEHTRFDFLLQQKKKPAKKMVLEVKSVTLVLEKGLAQFPDAITLRGQKHLALLNRLAATGTSAGLVFLIMRSDCNRFSPAAEIDPRYAKLLVKAMASGVQLHLPAVHVNRRGFYFRDELMTWFKS